VAGSSKPHQAAKTPSIHIEVNSSVGPPEVNSSVGPPVSLQSFGRSLVRFGLIG
jgi:hypothetical protein